MGYEDFAGRPTGMSHTPPAAPSQQIAEGAENSLRHNSYLALKNVRCECCEGVLTLRGCLPTYYLKQMAQAVVGRIEGVRRIVNEIEVVAAGPR
jgi:osmotically-inducible protein OsmY